MSSIISVGLSFYTFVLFVFFLFLSLFSPIKGKIVPVRKYYAIKGYGGVDV
jgi:hypothetical protein